MSIDTKLDDYSAHCVYLGRGRCISETNEGTSDASFINSIWLDQNLVRLFVLASPLAGSASSDRGARWSSGIR